MERFSPLGASPERGPRGRTRAREADGPTDGIRLQTEVRANGLEGERPVAVPRAEPLFHPGRGRSRGLPFDGCPAAQGEVVKRLLEYGARERERGARGAGSRGDLRHHRPDREGPPPVEQGASRRGTATGRMGFDLALHGREPTSGRAIPGDGPVTVSGPGHGARGGRGRPDRLH